MSDINPAREHLIVPESNPLIVGCNYHTRWQSDPRMRFILVQLSGFKARLTTRTTGRAFQTNTDDLIFIQTTHNWNKAKKKAPHLFHPQFR